MSISVVIPTRNSFVDKNGSLALTLLSLSLQTIAEKLEVIVVDNASTDTTMEYLSQAPLRHRTKVVTCYAAGNRSLARNIGVAASSGERLVFLDDDVVFRERDTLERALTHTPVRHFACGARRFWLQRHWDRTAVEASVRHDSQYLKSASFLPCGVSRESGYRDLQEFSFIGNFGVIERSVFDQVGGFDAERFPSRREDVELMFRLLRQGVPYTHLFRSCRCFHLTHRLAAPQENDRQKWHERFREEELRVGYRFRVNVLFGVLEGLDGSTPVLEAIS